MRVLLGYTRSCFIYLVPALLAIIFVAAPVCGKVMWLCTHDGGHSHLVRYPVHVLDDSGTDKQVDHVCCCCEHSHETESARFHAEMPDPCDEPCNDMPMWDEDLPHDTPTYELPPLSLYVCIGEDAWVSAGYLLNSDFNAALSVRPRPPPWNNGFGMLSLT